MTGRRRKATDLIARPMAERIRYNYRASRCVVTTGSAADVTAATSAAVASSAVPAGGAAQLAWMCIFTDSAFCINVRCR